MRKSTLSILLCLSLLPAPSAHASKPAQILESYVEDFRKDPAAGETEVTFGVKIEGSGAWHVDIDRAGGVNLRDGLPPEPTFLYVTDPATLRRMDRGELAVITAMGRARSSDPAPMDFELMEGYAPPEDFMAFFTPFTFHFWTRGFPETVRFGKEEFTRKVHGANVTAFYYQKGFRSAWYQIKKGQHINQRAEDQVNPFPTLAIFIAGEAEARIGGEQMKLEEGVSVLIPAGVTHEFWNDREQPAEFIIIMFGEGA